MTQKEELELMKKDPKALYDYYIQSLLDGQVLSEEQLIRYEYCKKIILGE
jgi:hypothetical protein